MLRLRVPGDPAEEACRTLLCMWQEQDGGRKRLRDAIGHTAVDAHLDDPADTRLILSTESYPGQASLRETVPFGRPATRRRWGRVRRPFTEHLGDDRIAAGREFALVVKGLALIGCDTEPATG